MIVKSWSPAHLENARSLGQLSQDSHGEVYLSFRLAELFISEISLGSLKM